MKPIVVVENVRKRYSRNAQHHLSYGLRDLFRELLGRETQDGLRADEFWAVDDVSFHLHPGDSFALVGRNGSGKTTLLKMMNGLVKPDAGTLLLDGRVQALINLGAGFNPALSGRENVYNSAALMGLGRRATTAVLDRIVDFAELDDFIDSPVQTYSQGMYARLGFAVAVHLQPDILLIDEILSVGDYAFQNKCFIKLHELKKQGTTIVLVSHSHTHVLQLCERALWIHRGRTQRQGPAQEVIEAYLAFLDEEEVDRMRRAEALRSASGPAPARSADDELHGPIYDELGSIADLEVALGVGGRETDVVRMHDDVVVRYSFRLQQPVTDLNISLVFARSDGLKLTTISTLNGDLLKHIHEGEVRCEVRIPDFPLTPGEYVLVMPIHEGKSYLYRNVVKRFRVVGSGSMAWQLVDLRYEYRVDTG